MTASLAARGRGLIHDALATEDTARTAVQRHDWNLAVRAAHDAMERAVKGGICLLGSLPLHGHGAVMIQQWREVLEAELHDMASDAAFIAGGADASAQLRRTSAKAQVRKVVGGYHTMLGEAPTDQPLTADLDIQQDGSTIAGYIGGQPVLMITDTSLRAALPERIQLPFVDNEDWRRLIRACRWLAARREKAFYRETEFNRDSADRALSRMHEILAEVRRQFLT